MLPSTPQVEAVYLNEDTGILSGLLGLPVDTPPLASVPVPEGGADGTLSKPTKTGRSDTDADTDSQPLPRNPHTVLIDQTTLDPTAAVSVAARIRDETGGRALMLDAPVSGGESLTVEVTWQNASYRGCWPYTDPERIPSEQRAWMHPRIELQGATTPADRAHAARRTDS